MTSPMQLPHLTQNDISDEFIYANGHLYTPAYGGQDCFCVFSSAAL